MTCIDSRRRRSCSGVNILELALTLPILLMLLSIVVDWGRFVTTRQNLAALTREGANLASRGTDSSSSPTNFPATYAIITNNAVPMNLTTRGRVYIGRVVMEAGVPRVRGYTQGGAFSQASRIMPGGLSSVATFPTNVVLVSNQTVYVVEVFSQFTSLMPLGGSLFYNLWNGTDRSTVYDYAIF